MLAASGTLISSVINIYLSLELHSFASPLLLENAILDSDVSAAIESTEGLIALWVTPRMTISIIALLAWWAWLYSAAKLLRRCQVEGLEYRPLMTIVWYFIPVMNLWKPFLVNVEIEGASRGRVDWKNLRPSGLATLASLAGASTGLATKAYRDMAERAEAIADVVFVIRFGIGVELLVIGAMVAMCLFISRITRYQRQLVWQFSLKSEPQVGTAQTISDIS